MITQRKGDRGSKKFKMKVRREIVTNCQYSY
jgi:hypothetical protein